MLGTVARALASEDQTRRWPRHAFRRGFPYGVFPFGLQWDTRLAYTGVYPIPLACQHAQPSLPNAERNLRNRPEVRVTRSTAKSADRYTMNVVFELLWSSTLIDN